MKRFFLAVALSLVGFNAHAVLVNPSNDAAFLGVGNQFVFQLDNGNFLGSVGLEDVSAGQAISLSDIVGTANSGGSNIVGLYFGDPATEPAVSGGHATPAPAFFGSWTGAPSEFDPFVDGTTIAATSNGGTKFFDSLWIEYTDTVVFSNGSGGTRTLGTGVTLPGDPTTPVPAPATLPLMLGAVAAFGFLAAKTRKAAA